ncbi:MAG: hypothetical protein ACRC7R_06295, partial [Sarcina sp.]
MTSGWSINNALTFNTTVDLNQGYNTIKFYGDGTNYAPSLGLFTLLPSKLYHTMNGVLGGEAILDVNSYLVGYIGGPKNSYSTIPIITSSSGKYNLAIQYLSTENRSFKVDVNDKNIGTYMASATKSWSTNDARFYMLRTNLNSGNNTIKLYGDGVNYTPSLGKIRVFYDGVYDLTYGDLSNGAIIDDSSEFVGFIGGPTDGSSTVVVNVDIIGTYTLSVQYISGENRSFKIDINGKDTGSIYSPSSTGGWSLNNSNTFFTTINLNSGNNTLKFHGNNNNWAPSFKFITLY